MKAAKGTINEALAQVANHNKELRPVVEATEGDICKCCDNKIDAEGKCGCDESCEHCGGHHTLDERVLQRDTKFELREKPGNKVGLSFVDNSKAGEILLSKEDFKRFKTFITKAKV